MTDADWHERAMRTHQAAAERQDEAARHWSKRRDEERAELERRAARIERELVELEGAMARVARERPIRGGRGAGELLSLPHGHGLEVQRRPRELP